MVKVLRIDKCLICEKEYVNNIDYVKNNKLPIEYNIIYCYKCVRKHNKKIRKN
jgi:hypothetical protein